MMYDIIVFENIGFRPSTRKREAGVFKNLHSGKMRFRRPISPDTCVDGRQNWRKKSPLSNKNGYVWIGP